MIHYTREDIENPAIRDALIAFAALLHDIDTSESNGHYQWIVFERAQELAVTKKIRLEQLTLADMKEVQQIAKEDFEAFTSRERAILSSGTDDIRYENDWLTCDRCEEEYYLPEDTEQCPICGSSEIHI